MRLFDKQRCLLFALGVEAGCSERTRLGVDLDKSSFIICSHTREADRQIDRPPKVRPPLLKVRLCCLEAFSPHISSFCDISSLNDTLVSGSPVRCLSLFLSRLMAALYQGSHFHDGENR